jgi:uncharacterized repeat protein (TIGR02543 family)
VRFVIAPVVAALLLALTPGAAFAPDASFAEEITDGSGQAQTVTLSLNAGVKFKSTATYRLTGYGKARLEVTSGEAIGALPVYYRVGYVMKGWYTKKKGGRKVTSKARLTADTKLYAHWKKAGAGAIARSIARRCKKIKGDRKRIQAATDAVAAFICQNEYSTSKKYYNKATGVFVKGVSSCAGSTRALGMVLGYMGYKWKHVNAGKWEHQWCKVYTKSGLMWADANYQIIGADGASVRGTVGKGNRKL